MCGIVGYAGYRQAQDVVLEGLSRLEYRGYDSAGVAVLTDGKISWAKSAWWLTLSEGSEGKSRRARSTRLL